MGYLTTYPKVVGKVMKFNKKMHDKYDIPAREKIKSIIGEFIIDNPDKFGQDMMIKLNNCKYRYLELQVCTTWINKKYPHDFMYIYARKAKYNSDTLFLTLNKKLEYGYFFDNTNINHNKPKRIKKYSRQFIYNIPWTDVIFVTIDILDDLSFELL